MTGSSPADLSLNEVETLAAKAARGAGFSWGEAEDFGRAARWLAARGLDWTAPLLALLEEEAARVPLRHLLWAADWLGGATAGESRATEAVSMLWALPIFAASLHGRDVVALAASPAQRLVIRPDGTASCQGLLPDATMIAVQRLSLHVLAPQDAPAFVTALIPLTRRSVVPPDHRLRLETFASRTTVPASAQSRATGAGGRGLDDE